MGFNMTITAELLATGGIVVVLTILALALMTKSNRGPFAKPVLMNRELITTKSGLFHLNQKCRRVAFVKVSLAPAKTVIMDSWGTARRISRHAKDFDWGVHELGHSPFVEVLLLDHVNYDSRSSIGFMVDKQTCQKVSMKTSGYCSVYVTSDPYKRPLLVEVFGF